MIPLPFGRFTEEMKPDPEVIEYIEQVPSRYRSILYRLRDLLYGVVPGASEAVKWGVPSFSYRGKVVCYIAAFKNHVTFAFYNGIMLNDPEGRLLGTGKWMRYLKFRSPEDIDEEQMKIWILEGFYT